MNSGKRKSAATLALTLAMALADSVQTQAAAADARAATPQPSRATRCALSELPVRTAQAASTDMDVVAADPRRVPELGDAIAVQGNAALRDIRDEMRREMLASMRPALADAEVARPAFTGESRQLAALSACAIWTP